MMEDEEFDIVAAFGGVAFGERFAVYIPNKDQHGTAIEQHRWVVEATDLLTDISGGATAMPPVSGAWLNDKTNEVVREEPVIVYSYVKPDEFVKRIGEVISFVKRMGKETNQGCIAVEYNGTFFTVANYD